MRKIKCGHCDNTMGRERYYAQWHDDHNKVSRSKVAFCCADCALAHYPDTPFFEKRIIGLAPNETLIINDELVFADGGGNTLGSFRENTLVQFIRQDTNDTGDWIYVVLASDYHDTDVEITVFPEDVRVYEDTES